MKPMKKPAMLKKIYFAFLFLMLSQVITAQTLDFKNKNASNSQERTMMLDIFRANLYQEYQQEFVFVVKHFKVGGNFAWLEAEAQRKDGKPIKFDGDEPHDCCFATALFKKSNGKWYLVESGAFGTDVWWAGVRSRHRAAPRDIFPGGNEYDE
jgi:hypothetical protein